MEAAKCSCCRLREKARQPMGLGQSICFQCLVELGGKVIDSKTEGKCKIKLQRRRLDLGRQNKSQDQLNAAPLRVLDKET